MCDSGGGGNTASAEKLYATQAAISQEQFDLWKSNFLPLEKELTSDVRQLSDPNYIGQRVGEAQQDVSSQFTAARGTQARQMQGLGINPNDGMYSSAAREMGLAEAGARAGAGNLTRTNLRGTALNAKYGLAGLGRGLSSGDGIGKAAGGLAQLGQQQAQAAAQNNAATGQAVGTAATMGYMAYLASLAA